MSLPTLVCLVKTAFVSILHVAKNETLIIPLACEDKYFDTATLKYGNMRKSLRSINTIDRYCFFDILKRGLLTVFLDQAREY